MGMKPCKECAREVSTSAKQCPHCGKSYPTGGLTLPAKLFIGFIILVAIGQAVGGGSSGSGTSTTASVQQQAVATVDTTITFRRIRQAMRDDLTEAQFKAIARELAGRRVRWTGWVEDVNEKTLGGYELWVDMDAPSELVSVQDVTFDVPSDLALALRKDSRVRFEGTIRSALNIMGSLHISLSDATILP